MAGWPQYLRPVESNRSRPLKITDPGAPEGRARPPEVRPEGARPPDIRAAWRVREACRTALRVGMADFVATGECLLIRSLKEY